MTYEESLAILRQAQNAYANAKTKEDVANIIIQYGQHGIGYGPLCKVLFAGQSVDIALKVYKR